MSLLSKYSRIPGINVILPSRGQFGPEGIQLDEVGTVRTFPMTANDEIIMNTPDLLISGRAINLVLESCVPDVPNPGELPNADVEALLLGIKANSSGEKLSIEGKCEKCSTEYAYDLSIPHLLQNVTFIDAQNIVEIEPLKILMRPLTWDESSKLRFELLKEASSFEEFVNTKPNQEQILKRKEQLHLTIRNINMKSILSGIQAVITPEGITNDSEEIAFFIKELNKVNFQKIEDFWSELNKKGLAKSTEIICENCNHTQEHILEYNPVNFSVLG